MLVLIIIAAAAVYLLALWEIAPAGLYRRLAQDAWRHDPEHIF